MITTLSSQHSLDRSTLWLMAVACGLCAGANYFCQPLIHSIQQHFAVSAAQAQLTISFAQISYALGLLFLVPLGDLVKKHIFVPRLMSFAALGLLISGFAPNIYVLWLGTTITGLFTVAAQVLIPLSAALVKPEKAGATVGFLMTGLLVGILISTSLAGLFSNLFAWNTIFIASAFLLLFIAYLLRSRLPAVPSISLSYKKMFISMKKIMIEEKRLIIRSGIGGFSFGSMSVLFATLALLLSDAPFYLSDLSIGLIGLTGLIGALFAQYAGKLADRGYSKTLTLCGVIILFGCWGLLYFSAWSLLAFIAGFTLINLGLSMQHTTNINIVYKLRDDAKARINSIYMTCYFMGAALGSALGTWAWNHGGWVWACIIGATLAFIALLLAIFDTLTYEKLSNA